MTAARKPRRAMVIHRPSTVQFGPPLRSPMRAVLLCVDAAKNSGCALYVCGQLAHYCEVKADDPHARKRVVVDAITTAEVRGELPLGFVIEASFGGYQNAALSLTATLARWSDTWVGLGQRKDAFLEITVGQWRAALFGRRGIARTQAREMESVVAHTTARRDLPTQRHWTIPPDACAAICIGQVAVRSSGIAEALKCSDQPSDERTRTP